MAKLLTNAYIAERYEYLKNKIGADMALYICCAICDAPYNPKAKAETWQSYVEESGITAVSSFNDGLIDPSAVLEQGATIVDEWKATWGSSGEDNPYTEADYKRLDELFTVLAERQLSAGAMDAQREHTLRVCSTLSLLQEKCIAKGDKENIDKAAKLDKMIQDNLSAEALRWKDAKPAESDRVDGFANAMKRKFNLSTMMTYDEVMEAFRGWLISHKYPETVDAAEHALLAMTNTTRENNDMTTLGEVPSWMKFPEDIAKREFASTPNDAEKEAFDYLDIKRWSNMNKS